MSNLKISDLLDYIFKTLSTMSALLPAIFVYIITNYEKMLDRNSILIVNNYKWFFFLSYILITIFIILVLNKIFLWAVTGLDNESISNIRSIEPVNDNFLPTYLGYFFVAVSITSNWVFCYFMLLVLSFNLFSKIYFFNPSLLLSGFKFYHLISDKGVKTLLISKEDLRSQEDVTSSNYKRINDFTFIKV